MFHGVGSNAVEGTECSLPPCRDNRSQITLMVPASIYHLHCSLYPPPSSLPLLLPGSPFFPKGRKCTASIAGIRSSAKISRDLCQIKTYQPLETLSPGGTTYHTHTQTIHKQAAGGERKHTNQIGFPGGHNCHSYKIINIRKGKNVRQQTPLFVQLVPNLIEVALMGGSNSVEQG